MNNELQFLIYNTPEEGISINAVVKDETIWLTQKAMAELFDVEVPAISKHISNIISEGELKAEATISKMEIVQTEGNRNVKRILDFYSLDAIISVGYRVSSKKLPDKKAKAEYDEFNKTQKINSDFEKEAKRLLKKGGGNNE